ncbi:ABC-type dipeptide/oligopeptide/nickel transport system permease component [Agrobacterium sp. SORGH_AS 745]|nr:ABC-type dipeptide/oligopeptide/nickel transport system permease component [Agrobacterium sp. SORGH_AS_0745]
MTINPSATSRNETTQGKNARWLAVLVRRLASLIVTLFAVSLIIYIIMGLLPGDPAAIMLGTSASPDTLLALQKQMGLDQPLPLRYIHWLAGVFRGDLGQSYTYGVPVAGLIVERLAVTLPLALLAVCLSVAIAIPLGVAAARSRNGPVDFAAGLFSHVGIAVPGFWVGLLLIIVFSTTLGWMPSGGFPRLASEFFCRIYRACASSHCTCAVAGRRPHPRLPLGST